MRGLIAWIRANRWGIVFSLIFFVASSWLVWLWESGSFQTLTTDREALSAELAALKRLHEENNQLQAEIGTLKDELVKLGTPSAPASSQVAGARASGASEGSRSAPANDILNLNTADQSQLETLPGIGPSKARAILDYRSANGPFKNPAELKNVKGIGEKTYQKLAPLVTVE